MREESAAADSQEKKSLVNPAQPGQAGMKADQKRAQQYAASPLQANAKVKPPSSDIESAAPQGRSFRSDTGFAACASRRRFSSKEKCGVVLNNRISRVANHENGLR
jgi:hypothetical protein